MCLCIGYFMPVRLLQNVNVTDAFARDSATKNVHLSSSGWFLQYQTTASHIEKSDAVSNGRIVHRECQMRHPCSNRLIFLFSMPNWSGLCFCVSYLLGTASSKKRCYVKAFRVYNNPTKFASLIDLFELGGVVQGFAGFWGSIFRFAIRTPSILWWRMNDL